MTKQEILAKLTRAIASAPYRNDKETYEQTAHFVDNVCDVFDDTNAIHQKFGVHEWVANNQDKLAEFMQFRLSMIAEELQETRDAVDAKDPEEMVDGLIDIIVFAVGTLDLFGVDGKKAWYSVYNANMSKEPGIKEGRPNPLGLPDMLKPADWQAPSHEGNHGLFTKLGE